jgi:archaeosine synthase
MAEGLGRTVLFRHRYARVWGLGDRSSPSVRTPAFISTEDDEDTCKQLAAFHCQQTRTIPARVRISTQHCLIPPTFDQIGPLFEASIGHVLPPSLDEADAGESADSGPLLPVSWQRLHHDPSLMDDELQPSIVILLDSVQLATQPGKLVKAIQTLKHRFPGALLWTPGLGGPDNAAVLAWFGVDLFDTSRVRLALSTGHLLTSYGPRLPLKGETLNMDAALNHYEQALRTVQSGIETGTLRRLAQQQSLNSPRLVEHMRHFDALMQSKMDVLRSHPSGLESIEFMAQESHLDAEVCAWVDFMTKTYQAPEGLDNTLVLLPCSERKPYRLSKSHRKFIEAIGTNGCHEVMVTSPLGLVPRELEDVWPAGFYDIPVTGNWTRDELERIDTMVRSLLQRHNYQCVINHSGIDLNIDGIEVINTRQGESSGARTALQRLKDAVLYCKQEFDLKRRKGESLNMDRFKSISRYLYDKDEWLDGCRIKGKPPRWRIEKDGKQIALWIFDRAGFAFSKESISILDKHEILPRIHLKPEVRWKGDIHLGILESFDEDIRRGQDLLVLQDKQPVGLARSLAPGWEWAGTPGRLAKMHQKK